MKKNYKLPSLIAVTAATLVASFAASIAWFFDKAIVSTNNNLTGSSDGAYFAYGDGTAQDNPDTLVKEGPYGIETPRHLYNLAWLQYIGYFNKVKDNTITPVYFELNANIDMTGWILPPIGTTTNPFIGEFNGKGYTISNLVVSNNYNEILETNKMPSAIRASGSISNVNIVGMFGVVGNLDNAITATYDSSVTSVSNFTIDNAEIKNSASKTLAGIAAGYVNGPLSDVGIVSSKITTSNATNYSDYERFTNISNYGVVGYCEEEYLGTVKNTVSEVYNATGNTYNYIAQEEGDSSGWGGSIDMRTMYDGLLNVYNSYSNNADGIYKYYDTRTIIEDIDGNVISDEQSGQHNNRQVGYTTGGDSYDLVHYGYEQKNSNNKVTASYTIARRDTSQYLYLYGHNDAVVGGQQNVTRNFYDDKPTFSISSSSHYIEIDGNNVNDTTNSANATKWFYDDTGYIKTTFDNGSTFTYLTYDNSYNLVATTNQNYAATWSRNVSSNNVDFYFTNDGLSYHVCYDNGWVLKTTEAPYYYIRSNQNYLSRDGANSLTNETNRNNATKWYLSSDNYFYPGDDDSLALVYYYYRRNNNNATVHKLYVYDATSSYSILYHPNAAMTQITAEGKTYSGWWGEKTDTYYVRYRNNSWSGSTTSSNVTIEEVASTSPYYVATPNNGSLKMPDTEQYTQDATYETKHTYFPLRQENNDGIPMDTNTGYVISGSDDSMAGDIRVSYYAKRTYLSNGVDTVYTINDSGRQIVTRNGTNQAIANTFVKYEASRSSMQTILNATNIYGLHFMDAKIAYGEGVSAIVESATINGETYENYELPTNCIDFNLKESGYINFFAGTYFSGNNSFFSLFQVERDESNKITAVKRITEVLGDDNEAHSYQYKFSDGTYSVPFMYSSGSKVTLNGDPYVKYSTMGNAYSGYSTKFKTSWVEKNTLTSNYAYYFEIPMNDGEYCLGSVDGGTGAYLMYLDIGANAKKTYRSEIIEYFKMIEEIYSYPKGVGVVLAAGNASSDKNSFCVCLKSSYNGTLIMEKVQNGDVEEGKYTGAGNEDVTYKYPNLVVKDKNGIVQTSTPTTTNTTEIKRLTFYDYDVLSDSLNKIVITDTFLNGTKTNRTVEKFSNFNITSQTGTADDSIQIYVVNGTDTINYTDSTDDITFATTSNTTKILIFNVVAEDGGTLQIVFRLNVTSTENEGHLEYNPSGYEITITLTNGEGETTDITATCYVTTVVNNDGTFTYTFTINGTTAVTGGEPIVITVPQP